MPEDPLLAELRGEIFAPRRFEEIDFRREARNAVAASDAYTPHSTLLRVANAALRRIEPAIPRGVRERALGEALTQVEYAHRTTAFLEIGPVSKAFGAVVLHAAFTRMDGGTAALRRAMVALWADPGERRRTMRLLSTDEERTVAFYRSFAKVVALTAEEALHRRPGSLDGFGWWLRWLTVGRLGHQAG